MLLPHVYIHLNIQFRHNGSMYYLIHPATIPDNTFDLWRGEDFSTGGGGGERGSKATERGCARCLPRYGYF